MRACVCACVFGRLFFVLGLGEDKDCLCNVLRTQRNIVLFISVHSKHKGCNLI